MSFRGQGGGRGRGQYGNRTWHANSNNSGSVDNGSGGNNILKRLGSDGRDSPQNYSSGDDSRRPSPPRSRQRVSSEPHGRPHSPGTQVLKITGFTHTPDPQQLAEFLNARAANPVNILNIETSGDTAFVTVQHAGQATTLQKLSGIRFRGASKLTIELDRSASPRPGTNALTSDVSMSQVSNIEVLRDFVRRRFNPDVAFLDLSDMSADPTLRQFQISPDNARIPPVICKLASEICPNVQSVSLAKNQLRSLHAWSALSKFLPGIVNLSLRDNQVVLYKDLVEHLSGASLPNLRELELLNNPVRDNNLRRGHEEQYRNSISGSFPSLRVLDGTPLQSVSFAVAKAPVPALPVPVAGNFFDSPATSQTALGFLSFYFGHFDTNRNALFAIYHADALFSYTTVESSVHRSSQLGSSYRQGRNLKLVQDPRQRLERLHYGPQAIVSTLNNLPASKHSLDTSPTDYVVDAWQVSLPPNNSAIMFISVHGSFLEANNSNRKRHFDRMFTLVPSLPGSDAANQNIPLQITQDELVVRTEAGTPAPWKAASNPAATPLVTPTGLSTLPPKPADMSDVDYQLIVNTMQQFGLTFDGAFACLSQTQGNVHAIGELKNAGQIPAHFFG
ncbi:nuclear mRNA export, poly(A)+RNA binding protein [Sorochytrium milnesiophthora]